MRGNSNNYSIASIGSERSPHLAAVVDLGDANRRSLGFLPRAGFVSAASENQIVLALDVTGQVAGYCLYGLTQKYVRIVHLCVAEGHHGLGLSRQLVETVRERHADTLGLKLKCRRDWEAHSLWPKLGFQPVGDVVGRSKAGHLLTVWWSANHHDDLFTVVDASQALLVAADTNVFSDLHSLKSPDRRRFSGAIALLAGAEEITLAVPHSVVAELNDTVDDTERRHLIHTAAMYPKLSGPQPEVHRISDSLLSRVSPSALTADPSLHKDALFLAEAVTGHADVFVTRDDNLIAQLGDPATEMFNLTVMQPAELPAHLHRRQFSRDYQPARLAETELHVTRGDSKQWGHPGMLTLLNRPGGERKSEFQQLVRGIAERSAGEVDRYLLLGPEGVVIAAWALVDSAESTMRVPLFRVSDGRLQETIVRQLAFGLRREAVSRGVSRVVLDDQNAPAPIVSLLEADGFAPTEPNSDRLWARVVDHCGPWSDVRTAAATSASPPAESNLSEAEAAELERIWWPAKILDSTLPCYVVPIKGGFADELLGHSHTLLARDAALGLSREHVYYRSNRNMPSAPGRVLWYSSGRDQQLVACSRLVEAVTGTPESLHREFRRYGVWDLAQVRGTPRRDRVGALRFADTEVFPQPVSLMKLRRLSQGIVRLPGQGPTKIPSTLFATLYAEGRKA